jgi:hypothetical protein
VPDGETSKFSGAIYDCIEDILLSTNGFPLGPLYCTVVILLDEEGSGLTMSSTRDAIGLTMGRRTVVKKASASLPSLFIVLCRPDLAVFPLIILSSSPFMS